MAEHCELSESELQQGSGVQKILGNYGLFGAILVLPTQNDAKNGKVSASKPPYFLLPVLILFTARFFINLANLIVIS